MAWLSVRQIGWGLSAHLASALHSLLGFAWLGFQFVKSAGVYLPIRPVALPTRRLVRQIGWGLSAHSTSALVW